MAPKIKTVNVQYGIRVNEEQVDAKPLLREARAYVKTIPLTDMIKSVTIVKMTTTEQVLDIYEPKQVTVLKASQLDEDLYEQ